MRPRWVIAWVAAVVAIGVAIGAVVSLGNSGAPSLPPAFPAAARAATSVKDLHPGFLGVNGGNIRSNRQAWTDPRLLAAVRRLGPGNLRFFGGSTAEYWDWQTGLFDTSANSNGLYRRYNRTGGPPLTLADWAQVAKAAGAVPVYDLNMVTKSLDDQVAMLHAAQNLGLPVTRVELGNEMWEHDKPILRAFPTAADYGRVASAWAARLHREFPGVQVAASAYGDDPTQNARKAHWDEGLRTTLSGEDAMVFHTYFGSRLGQGERVVNGQPATTVFDTVQQRLNGLDATLAKLPTGVSAWITEFGLLDHSAGIHGTWAQGLAVAQYALGLTTNARVSLADVQQLLGGPTGVVYGDANALHFSSPSPGDQDGYVAPSPVPSVTPFGLGPVGAALRPLFTALGGAQTARALSFTARSGRRLVGAVLATPHGQETYLLNLTDAPAQVSLPAGTGSHYEQTYAEASTVVANANSLRTASGTVGQNLRLPPYSVTLLH